MGVLIAKKYPTKLFAKAADHTYVECGNGNKAWGCWGGKTGGTAFNTGNGSTKRANVIAESDEKANIRCYLINGVCHQAANRILIPAGILVSGARGYWVSSGIFGTYGRPGRSWLNPCYSPFRKHSNISGDLKECSVTKKNRHRITEKIVVPETTQSMNKEVKYLKSVRSTYSRYSQKSHDRTDNMKFNLRLFERDIQLKLGDESDLGNTYRTLLMAKENLEVKIAGLDISHDKSAEITSNDTEFVKKFNDITREFQDDVANSLNEQQFQNLFELKRDERVVLADPDIISSVFGEEVMKNVYSDL
ncbi:hypothetical protein [Gracilimonas sediminicola]|uniref:hypothetical protein n=1 Tax=Gracilimonas sediminicola TaxID=2952158 RepID=UPI0038D3E12E